MRAAADGHLHHSGAGARHLSKYIPGEPAALVSDTFFFRPAARPNALGHQLYKHGRLRTPRPRKKTGQNLHPGDPRTVSAGHVYKNPPGAV